MAMIYMDEIDGISKSALSAISCVAEDLRVLSELGGLGLLAS
jgi:hypothetical protein